MPKQNSNDVNKSHPLVGVWVNGDEFSTDVQYLVSVDDKGFCIRVVDSYDGEEAEVYDVNWNGAVLSFATHWQSTGRFVKCRLQSLSKNRIDFTYTYSQQEVWHRKRAKTPASHKRQTEARTAPPTPPKQSGHAS